MSRSKSQFKSKSDVTTRTSTAGSVPLSHATSSIISTRTRNSFQSAFFNFMRDFKQRHANKQYQYVIRLGARRWHSMTQTDRAPYVLEAARNKRTAKPRVKMPAQSKKKQNQKDNNQDKKRCPACGHRKSSREKNRSRSGSRSDSSNSSKSNKSNCSK